jgi:hypothetical protein
MAITKRSWTADDNAKLKDLAGKQTVQEIAKELGRSEGAVAVQACKMELSLSTGRRSGRSRKDAQAEAC